MILICSTSYSRAALDLDLSVSPYQTMKVWRTVNTYLHPYHTYIHNDLLPFLTGPHEMTHWANMMGSQRHAVAQWHSLHSRSHCDQVSLTPDPPVQGWIKVPLGAHLEIHTALVLIFLTLTLKPVCGRQEPATLGRQDQPV